MTKRDLHAEFCKAAVVDKQSKLRFIVVRNVVELLFSGVVLGREPDETCTRAIWKFLEETSQTFVTNNNTSPLCGCCGYEFKNSTPEEFRAFVVIFAGLTGYDNVMVSALCKKCIAKSDETIATEGDAYLHGGNLPSSIEQIEV